MVWLDLAAQSRDGRELSHERVPSAADLRPNHLLRAIPVRNGVSKHPLSRGRQPDLPFAPILARSTPDPSFSLQRPQGTTQCRAIEDEDLAQTSLADPAGERERLEERELRNGQADGA